MLLYKTHKKYISPGHFLKGVFPEMPRVQFPMKNIFNFSESFRRVQKQNVMYRGVKRPGRV